MKATTQFRIRSALHSLTRQYRTDLLQLYLRRLNTTIYIDTLVGKYKSIADYTVAQVYTDGQGYTHVDPRASKSLACVTLDLFYSNVGIPDNLVYDGSKEQVGPGSHFQEMVRRNRIQGRQNEAYTENYNRAED